MTWSNLSKNLMSQIEQIEGGLRLMVRALIGGIKKVQSENLGTKYGDGVLGTERDQTRGAP